MQIVDTTTAPHYRWGDNADGLRLLDMPGVSVIEERMPVGSAETMHRHAQSIQCFYVLEGMLDFELETGKITVRKGQSAIVRPPEPHRAVNPYKEETRFLVISAPSTANDREDL